MIVDGPEGGPTGAQRCSIAAGWPEVVQHYAVKHTGALVIPRRPKGCGLRVSMGNRGPKELGEKFYSIDFHVGTEAQSPSKNCA